MKSQMKVIFANGVTVFNEISENISAEDASAMIHENISKLETLTLNLVDGTILVIAKAAIENALFIFEDISNEI